MRNLKKILALVLALVMSLSLMATAGAAQFPDVDDSNPYKTAIDVLDELKVFQGFEDGSFKPTDTLNRAQAAVLVYRIATGDVENKYLDNYTYMQQSKFTDLDGYNWAKGYINYCQNAGIVVGTSATTFDPGAKVTGYQLLVMLLRTLGYGKAGEFADPKGWELQTATIAEREGITENVTTGDFGAPAPRQMVAEILFRGLLTETVEYSALTPGGYTKGETLGMREFKLEEIEGVIVGNEFADLNSNQVLAEGKTALQVEGEDAPRTLNITSLLTDVGESRLVYTQNTSKVLSLADTGKNKVTEFGHACDISTPSKFNDVAEMPAASDIEYYRNFDRAGYWTSDYRIEYELTDDNWVGDTAPNNWADPDVNGGRWTWTNADDLGNPTATSVWTYHKLIPATQEITSLDYDNIRDIFYESNGRDILGDDPDRDNLIYSYSGKVFVGTQTTKDISDEISWSAFLEKYINEERYDVNWNTSYNGAWVKFVDNDGDGQCDYAFWTGAALDEVIGTYKTKDGVTVMQYNRFDDLERPEGYTVRYMDKAEPVERDVEIEDKVIVTKIDNQYLIGHADSVTKTVNKYNWKDDIITTTDGDEYGQSQIGNWTDMMQWLSDMDEKTEYVMYLDSFGYVRAFELPGGTNYALVTELYYTNANIGNLVQNWPMTVELWNGEEGKDEYSVNNSNPFNVNVSRGNYNLDKPFTEVRSIASDRSYYNWLQPAIAHLGVGREGFGPTFGTAANGTASINNATQYTFWNKNYQLVNIITTLNDSAEFDYGTQRIDGANRNPTTSYTNVAIANIGDGTADIKGAAQLKLNRNGQIMAWPGQGGDTDGIYNNAGETPRYAVDYIQLTTDDVAAGQVRYPIADDPVGNEAANNYYVNAVHDTEFYVVYNGDVFYTKDYANMIKLTNKDNVIHAAYAVARDTSADNADKPYWVADVIVYEVQTLPEAESATSISLAYYNPSRTTGNVQLLETLNSKSEDPMINIVPKPEGWNAEKGSFGNYSGYGFYELINETLLETGELAASKIKPIVKDFNSKGIYAGTLTREVRIATDGSYIDVNLTGATNADGTLKTEASVKILSNIYSITQDTKLSSSNGYFNEAEVLQYSNVNWSEVQAGDRVIWVGGGAGKDVSKASFIVDLSHGSNANGYDDTIYNTTAAFLGWRNVAPSVANNWDPAPAEASITGPFAGSNLIDVTGDANRQFANWPLWAAINKEQKDAVIATWDIEYTVLDENGDAVAAAATPTTVLKSAADDGFTVDTTAIVAAGYDIANMTVTNQVDGDPAATCTRQPDGSWKLTGIKGDVEVTINVIKQVETVTITIKQSGLPTGAAWTDKTVEVPVTGLKEIDLTAADYVFPGYAITAVAVGTTNPGGTLTTTPAAPSAATPATKLTITTPTQDGDIQLTYTAVTTSFKATLTPVSGGTFPTVTYNIPATDISVTSGVASNQTGTLTSNTNITLTGTGATLNYNGAVTLTWTPTANCTYAVSGLTNGTSADGITTKANGDMELVVNVTGAANLTITETKEPVAKIVDGTGADATVAFTVPTGFTSGDEVQAGAEVKFTVTPAAGKEIKSVSYQISGKPAVVIDEANITEAAGVWTVTLPDAAIEATKTTTITVETVNTTAAELTFTVTGTPAGLAYVKNGEGNQTAIANNDTVSVKPGDVLTITANVALTVEVPTAGQAAWGGAPAATGAIETSADGLTVTVTIPNIDAATGGAAAGGIGLTIAAAPAP